MDVRESLGKKIKKRIKDRNSNSAVPVYKEIDVTVSAVEFEGEIWTYAKAWFDLDNGLLFSADKSRLLREGEDYYFKNNQLYFT